MTCRLKVEVVVVGEEFAEKERKEEGDIQMESSSSSCSSGGNRKTRIKYKKRCDVKVGICFVSSFPFSLYHIQNLHVDHLRMALFI